MARHSLGLLAFLVSVLAPLAFLGSSQFSSAVPIAHDPNGFETIPWGSILEEMKAFIKVDDAGRVQAYELSGQIPMLGEAPVNSLRFTTFEKKLGRVTARYTGQTSHAKILSYLESKYGPLDRTPGKLLLVRPRSTPGKECTQRLRCALKAGLNAGSYFLKVEPYLKN